MPLSSETSNSRTLTDDSLRTERQRSDEELLARSAAFAEDAEEVIARARERAREVLQLARDREDERLEQSAASAQVSDAIHEQRTIEDATLAKERTAEDTQRYDERERRRAAVLQLLAHERSTTDRTLSYEREVADRSVSAREDLLGVVAHDLRGLLNTITINASVALLAPDPSRAAQAAASIQRASAQMTSLVDDLLDFSTFQAGKLAVSPSTADLVQLVRDAVAIHDALATAEGVTLAMNTAVESLALCVDGKRITRLLVNLIANALKFTPRGGRVDVTVTVLSDECEIAVRDTGIGIPADQLVSIFERFQQVGRQRRRASGVGLGLYIARLIVEAHRGRIWAESELGAGATFRVRLPLGSRSSARQPA